MKLLKIIAVALALTGLSMYNASAAGLLPQHRHHYRHHRHYRHHAGLNIHLPPHPGRPHLPPPPPPPPRP